MSRPLLFFGHMRSPKLNGPRMVLNGCVIMITAHYCNAMKDWSRLCRNNMVRRTCMATPKTSFGGKPKFPIRILTQIRAKHYLYYSMIPKILS